MAINKEVRFCHSSSFSKFPAFQAKSYKHLFAEYDVPKVRRLFNQISSSSFKETEATVV